MKATEISRINNKFWIMIIRGSISIRFSMDDLSNDRSKWPASIFADNRIAKVQGRIKFLIVSIKTINLISNIGVFNGTRWASICFVFLIHPNSINVIHSVNDKDKLKFMCLVKVNVYGISLKKFNIRIM